MQFQYFLLFLVYFQDSHTLESKTSKEITVKGDAFMCSFHIQYEKDKCFQNSTVSCSPNQKTRRTAKNVTLELNDGTKVNIEKLKISRKRDKIINCGITSMAITGHSSCSYTDKDSNCANWKDPDCTSGKWVDWMMTNCAKTCKCTDSEDCSPLPDTWDRDCSKYLWACKDPRYPLFKEVCSTSCNYCVTTTTPEPNTEGDCVCGLAQRQTRITGGEETEINEYPWLTLLSSGCGGSLINDRWVLTAAHCTEGRTPSQMFVILGEHDWTTGSETSTVRRSVTQIVDHPNYNGHTLDWDFSLLKMSESIDFTQYTHIRPVCLPSIINTGSLADHEGEKAMVAGWGITSPGGPSSNYAREADITIYSRSQCNRVHRITDRMICAGNPVEDSGSCKGDSGGPLMYTNGTGTDPGQNYEVMGVVSWGRGRCTAASTPGVYAKVSYVVDWIKETANDGIWCPRIPGN